MNTAIELKEWPQGWLWRVGNTRNTKSSDTYQCWGTWYGNGSRGVREVSRCGATLQEAHDKAHADAVRISNEDGLSH